METFRAVLLQPDISDSGMSGITKQYTENALRNSIDTLIGSDVFETCHDIDSDSIVGTVLDAEYREESHEVVCTVCIENSDISSQLERGLLKLAPRIHHESVDTSDGTTIDSIEFTSVFTTAVPTEQVGEVTAA